MLSSALSPAVWLATFTAAGVNAHVISGQTPISVQDGIVAEAGGMHNVRITYNQALDGDLSLHYGPCDVESTDECHHSLGRTYVGSHPLAKRHDSHEHRRPTRFVWLPPVDTATGGCLHAFSGNVLVGRSGPITVVSRKEKRWEAVSVAKHSLAQAKLTLLLGCRHHGCGRPMVRRGRLP